MLEYGDFGIKGGEDIYAILANYREADESNGPLVRDIMRAIADRYGEDCAWGMLADALELAIDKPDWVAHMARIR